MEAGGLLWQPQKGRAAKRQRRKWQKKKIIWNIKNNPVFSHEILVSLNLSLSFLYPFVSPKCICCWKCLSLVTIPLRLIPVRFRKTLNMGLNDAKMGETCWFPLWCFLCVCVCVAWDTVVISKQPSTLQPLGFQRLEWGETSILAHPPHPPEPSKLQKGGGYEWD